MASIIVGSQLGLVNSSLNTLNLSQANAGKNKTGESVYVNAATGNLVIQRPDENLAGRGLDLTVVQTYNSQGVTDGDNNDNWRIGFYRQLKNLTGVVNTAGSLITRVDEDGAALLYSYDVASGEYINKDGAGSYDRLRYNSSTALWTWTDGDSRVVEVYKWGVSTGSLSSQTDSSGNRVSYTYNAAGLLTKVSGASGENIYLDYSGSNLQQVRTEKLLPSDGTEISTRVRYSYDASNRLSSVTVDLSPDDNSILDNKTYRTNYAYDGTSKRIATMTQTDGTSLSFLYDSFGRVTQITDALGGRTNYSYDTANRITTVTDSLSQRTTYAYNNRSQLLGITSAAVNGASITQTFTYNENDDVATVTDGEGNTVIYQYDVNGNRTSQHDTVGNTIDRTYNSNNQVLTETRYIAADPDGAGIQDAIVIPLTTRYVYSNVNQSQLRFAISPEGRVVEYRYDASGQKISEIAYAGNNYAGMNVNESDLNSWVANNADKSQSQRTDYSYDFRGQLSSSKSYNLISSTGLTYNSITTTYIYSPAGQLLQKQAVIGNNGAQTTTYSYDGLGRLLTSTNPLNQSTQYQYADSGSAEVTSTTQILPNGLRIISSYDRAGRLVSVMQTDSSNSNLGTTSYYYDSTGRLRMTEDPTGLRNWIFYDAAGRKAADIDTNGTLTEYAYDKNSQITQSIRYAQAVSLENIAFVLAVGGPTGISVSSTLDSLRPAADVADQKTWNVYDTSGRLIKTVDAGGSVTETKYDTAGRIFRQTKYANTVNISALGSAPASTNVVPVPDAANDRVTRYFYDKDGLLRCKLDGESCLTETMYDHAGQAWQTIQYATKLLDGWSNQSEWVDFLSLTTDIGSLRPASTIDDIRTFNLYDNAGKVSASIDGKNYLTEYIYDNQGNLIQTKRYATALGSATVDTLTSHTAVSTIRPANDYADQTSSISYDALNRVNTRTDEKGTVTKYQYDSTGNLISTTIALGTTDARTASNNYDLQGRLISNIDARGNTTTYRHDSAGRVINSTDASGNRTLYYYDTDDQLVYTINALGEVTGNTYNVLEQKTAVTQYGTRISTGTLATMNGGLVNSTVQSAITAITNTVLESRTVYAYNPTGTLASSCDPLGNLTLYQYNAFGEQSSVTLPISAGRTASNLYAYDKRGLGTSITADSSELNITVRQEFDAFGRTVRTTDGNGNVRRYSYDKLGRQVQTIDERGNSTSTSYDAFNRAVTQTDATGNTTTTTYDTVNRAVTISIAGISVRTVYNRHGQTQTVQDGNGNITNYTYDAFGNLGQVALPESRTTTQTFDASNRLAQSSDANGTITAISYDAANRVLSKTVDPGGLNLVTQYGYDAKGRQITVTDPNGSVTQYDYDLNGQLIRKTLDSGAGRLNLATRYSFDAQGRQLTVTAANGSVNRNIYDNLGRMTYTVDAIGALTKYDYDANGNVVRQTRYANTLAAVTADPTTITENPTRDQITRNVYDAGNHLTFTVDGIGAVTKFDYDANGNVIKKIRYANTLAAVTADPATVTVDLTRDQITRNVYDASNRLVFTADGSNAVTGYQYDANGNITRETRYATAVGDGITDPSTVASNTSTDQVTRHFYDAANRLTLTVDPMGAVKEYTYDGNGNLTKQTSYANALMSGKAMSLASLQSGDQRVPLYPWLTGFAAGDTVTMTVYFKGSNNQVAGQIVLDVYSAQGSYLTSYGSSVVYDNGEWQKLTITRTLTQNCSLAVWIMGDQGANRPVGQYGYYDNLVVSSVRKGLVFNEQFETAAWGRGTLVDPQLTPLFGTAVRSLVTADAGSDRVVRNIYDANNRLVYTVDAMGAVTGYQYENGNVTRQTRYAQTIADSTRNAWGANAPSIATIEMLLDGGNADNRTILMEYDALGRVVQITQPGVYAYDGTNSSTDSPVTRHTYNALGQIILTRVKRVNNTWLDTYHYYDQRGLETATIDAAEFLTTQSYDSFGNILQRNEYAIKATNVTISGYAPQPSVNGDRTWNYTYDRNNRKVTQTRLNVEYSAPVNADNFRSVSAVRGNLTDTYFYDTFGNQIQMTDANGSTVRTYYDRANRIKAVTEPVRPTSTQNSFTGITDYRRDTFGNLIRQSERVQGATSANAYTYIISDNPTDDRTTLFRYDRLNRVSEITDVLGGRQEFAYDALGNVTRRTSSALDANGVLQKIDKLLAYDNAGRLKNTTEPGSGAGQTVTTQMRYNAFGELTGRGVVGVEGGWSEYFDIDSNGRVWRSNSGDGVNKVMLYDLQGNLTAEIRSATVDLKSQENSAAVNGLSNTRRTDNAWNALRNLTRQKLAERNVNGTPLRPEINRNYDRWGNLIASTDPANASWVTEYTYNSNNQITKETKPVASLLGNDLAAYLDQRPVTQYYYDYAGNQLAVRDARSNVIGKVYDRAGNVLEELNADGGRIAHGYDAFGNEVQRTDANGNVFSYSYNKLGQIKNTVRPSADFYTIDDIVFDDHTPVFGFNGWGRTREYDTYWAGTYLNTDASRDPVLQYTRSVSILAGYRITVDSDSTPAGAQHLESSGDLSGGIANNVGYLRVESIYGADPVVVSDGHSSSIGNTYDQRGQKLSVRDAAGQTVNYRYDLRGNIVEVTYPGSVVTSNTYDYLNRKNSETDANGNTQTWQYNYFGRLLHRTGLGGQSYDYFYDFSGKLTTETDHQGHNVQTTYDNAGQAILIEDFIRTDGSASFGRTTRYEYDLAGRRSYESTVVDSWMNGYDGEGDAPRSRVTSDLHSLAYNALGQLTTITSGSNVLGYKYDLVGNRTYQTENFGGSARESYFRYDVMNRQTLFDGTDANGTLTESRGMQVQYDLNGNRIWEIKGSGGWSRTRYDYDSLGRLVAQNAVTYNYNNGSPFNTVTDTRNYRYDLSDRVVAVDLDDRDTDGNRKRQLSKYDNAGRLEAQATVLGLNYGYGTESLVTSEYDPVGNLWRTISYGTGYMNATDYNYIPHLDTYKKTTTNSVNTIRDPNSWTGGTGQATKSGTSVLTYDVNGFLIGSYDEKADPLVRNRSFYNDVNGNLLKKEVNGGWLSNLVVNGNVLGTYGNEVNYYGGFVPVRDFLSSDSIRTSVAAGNQNVYRIRAGDSLQSIALAVYGDSQLWYLIADANGIRDDASLRVGETILLPKQLGTVHNNSGTFKPFDSAKFIGNTSPTVPGIALAPDQCAAVGYIILAVAVSIVITVAATAATAATLGALGIPAYTAAGLLISAVFAGLGGAAAAMASQGVMIAGGLKREMDWKEVGISAITGFGVGGLSAGIGALSRAVMTSAKLAANGAKALARVPSGVVSLVPEAPEVVLPFGVRFLGASMGTVKAAAGFSARVKQVGFIALRSVAFGAADAGADAAVQGICIGTGLQKKFDWSKTAAAFLAGTGVGTNALASAEKAVFNGTVQVAGSLAKTVGTKVVISVVTGAVGNVAGQAVDIANEKQVGFDWTNFGKNVAGAAVGGVLKGVGAKYLKADSKQWAYADIVSNSLGTVMGFGLAYEYGSEKFTKSVDKLMYKTSISTLNSGFMRVGRARI